jgi:hypothetical protein
MLRYGQENKNPGIITRVFPCPFIKAFDLYIALEKPQALLEAPPADPNTCIGFGIAKIPNP